MKTWMIGTRIAAGYAVILLFLVVVAAVGGYALTHTAGTFEPAIRDQGQGLVGALEQRGGISGANANFLRFMLTGDDQDVSEKGKQMSRARGALTKLSETSPTAELRSGWKDVLAALETYDAAMREAIAAMKAGHREEALRIRAERCEPLRLKLDEMADKLVAAEVEHAREVVSSAVAVSSRRSGE